MGRKLPRSIKKIIRRAAGIQPADNVLHELEPIPADALAFLQTAFPRRKFFLLGYARSGTTLLARLLNLHPQILCRWQGHFVTDNRGFYETFAGKDLHGWVNQSSNRWIAEPAVRTAMMRAAVDFLMEEQAAAEGAWIVGDKSPNRLGLETITRLHRIYPDARMLYILRDGRDVLYSKRIQMFVDRPDLLSEEDRRITGQMEKDIEPYVSGARSIFTSEWLEEAAADWAAGVSSSIESGEALYAGSFRMIRYEELLMDPVRVTTAAMDWLEAAGGSESLAEGILAEMNSNPAAEWHEQAAPDLVNGLPRGVAGAWKEVFTASDLEIFMKQAGDVMKRVGYA